MVQMGAVRLVGLRISYAGAWTARRRTGAGLEPGPERRRDGADRGPEAGRRGPGTGGGPVRGGTGGGGGDGAGPEGARCGVGWGGGGGAARGRRGRGRGARVTSAPWIFPRGCVPSVISTSPRYGSTQAGTSTTASRRICRRPASGPGWPGWRRRGTAGSG